MWVPGNLPPYLTFLITISHEPNASEDISDARDPVAAHAADQAAHLEDVDHSEPIPISE